MNELKVKVKEAIDAHLDSLDEGVQDWMYKKEYELKFETEKQ